MRRAASMAAARRAAMIAGIAPMHIICVESYGSALAVGAGSFFRGLSKEL